MKNKPFFPMFVDISTYRIVVIGAGKVAERRIETLLLFSEHIKVAAPEATGKIKAYAKEGRIRLERTRYKQELIQNADLVLAATNDPVCNEQVAAECKRLGIPVNVSHKKELCDFYFPGIAVCGNLTAAVTSGGCDHKQARKAREEITILLEKLEEEHQG